MHSFTQIPKTFSVERHSPSSRPYCNWGGATPFPDPIPQTLYPLGAYGAYGAPTPRLWRGLDTFGVSAPGITLQTSLPLQ